MSKTKMHSVFISFLAIIFFTSCNGQPLLGKAPLQLDELSMNFDVAKFYSKEKTGFSNNDPVSGYRVYGKDTVYSSFEEDTSRKVIGVQYNMRGWNYNDKLAVFADVYYCSVNMMVDTSNKFIALCATKVKADKATYENTFNALTAKYGQAYVQIDTTKSFGVGEVRTFSTWQAKDREIKIVFFTQLKTPKRQKEG